MDPLELQLQNVVSYLIWVLETRPRSSEQPEALLTTQPLLQPPDFTLLEKDVWQSVNEEPSYFNNDIKIIVLKMIFLMLKLSKV